MSIDKKAGFTKPRRHIAVSAGEITRMLRQLKGWAPSELSELSGITPNNISLIENNKYNVGEECAGKLAKAFDIHPSIILLSE